MRSLVLASTSPYRAALLARLRIPFTTAAPGVDESACAEAEPLARALALAEAKARAVGPSHPDSLVIGSDQVASCAGRRLDKPGTPENAVAQLRLAAGGWIDLATAVCVHDTRSGATHTASSPCRVEIRALDDAALRRYVGIDQPLDCAGAFRVEGAGSAIIARVEADDPTAIVGLPLILLVDLLARCGYDVLAHASAQAQS